MIEVNWTEQALDRISELIDEAWDYSNNQWKLGGVGSAVREAYRLGYNDGYMNRDGEE